MTNKKKKTRWDSIQPARIPCEKCGMPIRPFWMKRHKETCDKIPAPANLWEEMQSTPIIALEEIYNVSARKLRQHVRLYVTDAEAKELGHKMQARQKNINSIKKIREERSRNIKNGKCKNCLILLMVDENHLCTFCEGEGVEWDSENEKVINGR